MKAGVLIAVCVSLLGSWAHGASSLERPAPQTRPAGLADIHAQQALGRVIVAPDGRFMLYEWGHPYLDWVPDVDWMAPSAARRMETFLYKVDLTAPEPTSEYLFEPNAGATYWLGDLSPDSRHVAVFELDHDTNTVRAGVWALQEQKIRWFVPRPDEGQLGGVTAWISDEEFLYPAKGGLARLVRANVITGEARPCPECSLQTVQRAKSLADEAAARAGELAARLGDSRLPEGATLLAGSADGSVAVYARDDANVLMLMVKRAGRPLDVLFENPRQWPRPERTAAAK